MADNNFGKEALVAIYECAVEADLVALLDLHADIDKLINRMIDARQTGEYLSLNAFRLVTGIHLADYSGVTRKSGQQCNVFVPCPQCGAVSDHQCCTSPHTCCIGPVCAECRPRYG